MYFFDHLSRLLSANKDILSSFLFKMYPLITFSCVAVLVKTLGTALSRYGESGHHCLLPFKLMLAVGLL